MSSSDTTAAAAALSPTGPRRAVGASANYTHTHTHAYTHRFLSGCEEVEHTSQLPTTSQHQSPTQILPRSHTNIRIHAHTTPTHTSPTQTCMLMMERGFS